MIEVLRPGFVKVDYGPMQMTISASKNGRPETRKARSAAVFAIDILSQLAHYKEDAGKPQHLISSSNYPKVLNLMTNAVRQSGDGTLTPMAAVAGAMADMVADNLCCAGATKVIVNNGGDIALRIMGDEFVKVGISPRLGGRPTHSIEIRANDGIGGIATSGLGGRSFTKGIATAAVVTACSAAIADACATSCANAVYYPDPSIKLEKAGVYDPNSDIANHLVVTEVGELSADVMEKALINGYNRAAELYHCGVIRGAALFIDHFGIMLPNNLIRPLDNIFEKEGFVNGNP